MSKDADEQQHKPIELRNELENYAHWLRNRLQQEGVQMSAAAKVLLEDNVRATLDWLKANPRADVKVLLCVLKACVRDVVCLHVLFVLFQNTEGWLVPARWSGGEGGGGGGL